MNAQGAFIRAILAAASLGGGMLAGAHLAKGSDQTKPTSKRSAPITIGSRAGESGIPNRYYAFDTPFIINDDESNLIVQLRVALSSKDASTLRHIKDQDPAIRSSIIVGLTELGPKIVNGGITKKLLKSKIQASIDGVLSTQNANSRIEEIYLTDFLVVGLDG